MCIALSGGCSSQPEAMRSGTVTDTTALSELGVAYGRSWALQGDMAVDAGGIFYVPSSAGVVVAYLDTNENARLDRFSEPSGNCRLRQHVWDCVLRLRGLTLHRAISVRADHMSDKTFVFWEHYDANAVHRSESKVCLEMLDGRCTAREESPFANATDSQVNVLSVCGEEGFAPQFASIYDGGEHPAVRIAQPEELEVTHSLAWEGRGRSARLVVDVSSQAVDRALLWAASVDGEGNIQTVYWTSESADIDIKPTNKGYKVVIPHQQLRACSADPSCELGMQLVKYWRTESDASMTEYRFAIGFRGMR